LRFLQQYSYFGRQFAVSFKIKYILSTSSGFSPCDLLKGTENLSAHRTPYVNVYEALFIIAKTFQEMRYLSVGE
jgi:hypothetical protein